jgi:hypothetical protein
MVTEYFSRIYLSELAFYVPTSLVYNESTDTLIYIP